MGDLPERDWKYLRSIQQELLDRLCRRILAEIQAEIAEAETNRSAHETYLSVYKLVDRSDHVIGDCCDDWRRSTIVARLYSLISLDLLSDEEQSHLSDETRERICQWKELNRQNTFRD